VIIPKIKLLPVLILENFVDSILMEERKKKKIFRKIILIYIIFYYLKKNKFNFYFSILENIGAKSLILSCASSNDSNVKE
jgi:hypothetical protein